MTIGERIRQRRLELGLTVDELAKNLKKNRATVYRYESNDIENFPTTILEPLAKALSTTPAYLIGWEKQTETNREDTFDYFLEMQLLLMGAEIIYEEEDGYIILKHNKIEYEINENDVSELSSSVKSYISFKLHEILKHSRVIGSKAYLEVQAAHDRTDIAKETITDEMKQYDDDIMDDPNF